MLAQSVPQAEISHTPLLAGVADRLGPLGPPDPAGPAQAMIRQAFALLDPDPPAARRLAEAALAADGTSPSVTGQSRHLLGMVDCIEGRVEQGIETLRQAAEQLQRHGLELAACRALSDLGGACIGLTADLEGGMGALERARGLAESLGDVHEQGVVLARQGPLFLRLGRFDEAESTLRAAIAYLGSGDPSLVAANARSNLGYVLILRREYAGAVPLLEQARQALDAAGDRLSRLNCDANLSIALAGLGRGAEAMALLEATGTQLDPARDGYQWADYLLTAGRVHLLCNDLRAARANLLQGLEFSRAHGLHAVEIDCLDCLSEVHERCGDFAEALAVERMLRSAERQLLDERSAARVRALEANALLAEKRAENAALEQHRAELEERVQQRTEALTAQIEERRAAEEMARFWADHDWLTRLPNRHRMQKELSDALARARRDGTLLGVLFIDLDGFKAINDSYGHLAGDRVLRVVARRLLRALRNDALITRFGGDEFVVLLPNLVDDDAAMAVAQRLRSIVHNPVRLGGRLAGLSCSIGVAMGLRDASTPDELVRQADRAMLVAKSAGRNQVRALDASVQQQLDRRGRLRRDLGEAIAAGRLSCVFQPMLDVRSGRMAGAELLSRWHHPQFGAVSPGEFIPMAEESGLIRRLGAWTLREATKAALALRRRAGAAEADGAPRVSINLSTAQLTDPDLVASLLEAVRAEQGDPQWIEIELTESVQLAEEPDCQDRLRRLREVGFQLALDDFGAGYSSFSYLSRLYFDRLKIDRALVHAAMRTPERSAVTGSIIAMAQRLGMTVVAEGIETPEQQDLLAAQGCELMQGYHIARPMVLSNLLHWTRSR